MAMEREVNGPNWQEGQPLAKTIETRWMFPRGAPRRELDHVRGG